MERFFMTFFDSVMDSLLWISSTKTMTFYQSHYNTAQNIPNFKQIRRKQQTKNHHSLCEKNKKHLKAFLMTLSKKTSWIRSYE